MHYITTTLAPMPLGHYSQAVVHDGIVYVSGQLPLDPKTGVAPEGIVAQTRCVLQNLETVLQAAGSDMSHILKVTVYIADIALWAEMNAVYAAFFGEENKPARAAVPVPTLPRGCLLEIEAIAAVA